MWRSLLRVIVVTVAMTALNGCGWPDAYSSLPASLRLPQRQPRQPDPRPDAARLVREGIASLFTREAHARNVMISEPRRNPASFGWTVCLKASVTSITGSPIGVQTFLLFIDDGKLGIRRQAEPKDQCQAEQYERLSTAAGRS